MNALDSSNKRHAEVWHQLAWYANGSLAEDERRRVARHLEGCPECKRELAFLDGLRSSVREEGALLLGPERAYAKLESRIDAAEAAESGRLSWSDLARMARARLGVSRLAGASRRPVLVGAAVLAAMVAVWMTIDRAANEFHTLSAAEAPADPASPVIRVVFEGSATADDIQRLLNGADARIVDGPSPYGVYTVRLEPTVDPTAGDQRFAALVAELRRHPLVRFAEPISGADRDHLP